jgi:hypothetical protein
VLLEAANVWNYISTPKYVFYTVVISTVRHLSLAYYQKGLIDMLCLRSEDAYVTTCVANRMEVKFLYVQQDLLYEISNYWHFNV